MNNNYFIIIYSNYENYLKMKNYKNKKNNNIADDYLSSDKDICKNEQNYYLNKYRKIYGNSFNDVELLDIFAKHNYNDKQIKEDIETLLSFENNKKYDNYNNFNYGSYNSYDKNHKQHKSSSRSRSKKNKYEKRPFQKCIEVPSDYAPPPKKEEDNFETNNGNITDEEKKLKDINKIESDKNYLYKNNNIIINENINNDVLLGYKESLFQKLKNVNNSYKSNKSKKDEINVDILKSRNEYENASKKINLTEKNKNIKIENNSPGPECFPYLKTNIKDNINKDLKKKYIRKFFGNMKNYSNNLHRANWEKSPDFNRREKILDNSPDKEDFYERKVLTYKKGFKNNYYSNEHDIYSKNKKEYKGLKIEKKVNDFYISSCYDNPQRDQFLKIINEKRKENPDRIIEFLIPQFPPMFPPMQQFQNVYQPYNQYNPYMNMYMMSPPPQYPIQNPNQLLNNIPIPSINNVIGNDQINNSKNNIEKTETPENQNILTKSQIIQLNNNNQINVKINDTPNPNAFFLNNNNEMNNSKSNKSTGNTSSDANIHS